MKQISKNPYPNYSFEDFMNDKVAFIDKTEFIQTLYDLDSPYPILVRPHALEKAYLYKCSIIIMMSITKIGMTTSLKVQKSMN